MADKKNDQVNISNQTSDEKQKESYRVSDVQQLFEQSHPQNWQDLLKFIEKSGDKQWHITPGEAKSLKDDVQKAIDQKKPFQNDPKKAFKELKGS